MSNESPSAIMDKHYMKILQDIEDTGKSKGDEILFSDFDSARILADQNTLKKR